MGERIGTQEFRDEVLDWMELRSKPEVFAAVMAHDARIASEALIRAAEDIEANADPMGQPDPAWLAGMESAARRVRDRAEREGAGEGES